MGRGLAYRDFGALYVGTVVHKRARPKRHVLRYRVFTMLVDLDHVEVLSQLRLFSFNRWNLVSLLARDFGGRDGRSVAAFIREKASAAGIADIARVQMLAYPRVLGFAFNPITTYFCEDGAGVIRFIVYEVSNTFGEHHFYQAAADSSGQPISHSANKEFFVSPFNALEGSYRFSVRPPSDQVFVGVTLTSQNRSVLTAYFTGERRPLTDMGLLHVVLAYPFMTAKVVAGIYWEALILWLKGVPTTLHHRRQP
jgi:DUF1365 family protein